ACGRAGYVSLWSYCRTAPARSFRPPGLIGMRSLALPELPTFPTISAGLMICSACARSSTLSSAGPLSRRRMRKAAMQLHLAFLELADPPPSPTTPTNPRPWEQIDEAARKAVLEVLARLIASMLGAPEEEMPHE